MNLFPIILNQMEMLAIYIVIGIIGVKSGALNRDTLNHISRYIMKIGMPAMIFANATYRITSGELKPAFMVFCACIVMYIVLFGTSWIFAKTFKLEKDKGRLYRALSVFGNLGFIGLPIVLAFYPGKGIFYLSIFSIIDQGLLWTVGMKLSTPEGNVKKTGISATLKRFVNPAFIALVIGAVRMFTDFPLPAVLDATIAKVGATATPMSMIFIGGLFCYGDLKKYLKTIEYYAILVFKMIVLPIVLFVVLGVLNFPKEVAATLSLLAGLPTVTALAMMANVNGSDGDYATGAVFITTVASLVTLPFVSYIIGIIA